MTRAAVRARDAWNITDAAYEQKGDGSRVTAVDRALEVLAAGPLGAGGR